MMWVCRAGQKSCYFDWFMEEKKIFLPWDGYETDLNLLKTRLDFKELVKKEKNPNNSTALSNWSGMLFSFSKIMCIGDYLLIPNKMNRTYVLARIVGKYQYVDSTKYNLHHYREIEIVEMQIPRDIFSQDVQYSLGAFRSIFQTKHEDQILDTIEQWKKKDSYRRLENGRA